MTPMARSLGLLVQPLFILLLPMRAFVVWPWEQTECVHYYGPPEIEKWQRLCKRCGQWKDI